MNAFHAHQFVLSFSVSPLINPCNIFLKPFPHQGEPALHTPTLRKVNLLYLICMILVITLGSLAQSISFSWGLILTEIFFIFLPAWLMFRKEKINLRQLQIFLKPNGSLLLVSSLLGMGAWFVGSMIEILMVQITGYQTEIVPGIIPTSVFQAVLIFFGFAIAAPVCEEFVFRGIIQSTYQKYYSPMIAIVAASFLFAFFHMRLQGFPGLIPVALILGFTYWRTRSLLASMVVHFANNLFSVIVMIQAGLFPHIQLPFPSIQAASLGVMLLFVGIILLIRLTPKPEKAISDTVTTHQKWSTFWPLIISAIIFSMVVSMEILNKKPLIYMPLSAKEVPENTTLNYEMRHKGDEIIGKASCQISTDNEIIFLECQRTSGAFEVQVGNSYFSSLAGSTDLKVNWKKEDLSLIYLQQDNQTDVFSNQILIEPDRETFIATMMNSQGFEEQIAFTPQTLVTEEWAYQLMGLPFETQNTWIATYLEPFGWRPETEDNGPVLKQNFLIKSQKEKIQVPAGDFDTWKVQLMDGQAAWYTVSIPHIPVKIQGDVFDYYLIDQK